MEATVVDAGRLGRRPDRLDSSAGSDCRYLVVMLQNLAVLLSSLLIAAHFLRTGATGLVILCRAAPALLLAHQAWSKTVVRVFLALATLEWLRTLAGNVAERQSAGEPWLRMALIIGAVAAFTAMSAWLLRAPKQDL